MKKLGLLLLIVALLFTVVACKKPTVNTVKLDADNGSAVVEVEVTEGETVTKPADPTRDGYIFIGWFVGDAEYDFTSPVTSDLTITAKWQEQTPPPPVEYTVTFDNDGATDSSSVVDGEAVAKPADPTKDGHTFLGWFVGDAEYDFTSPVTSDLTLTAKWVYNLAWNDIIGSWEYVITEVISDVEAKTTYLFNFLADGTVKAKIIMEMYGMSFDEEIAVTAADIQLNVLTLTVSEDGEDALIPFVYEDGGLTADDGEGGLIALEPKNIGEVILGAWSGGEDYSGITIPYTLTVNEDGTVEASCDMFGSVSPLTLVAIDNKIVLNYMGAMTVTLVYDGEALVGSGVMGGTLTLTPYTAPSEQITLDAVAGEWHASEEFYGMVFDYVFVINADGTGSAQYSSVVEGVPYPTVMDFDKFVVEDNKLVLNYTVGGLEYDPIVLSLIDGKLVGVGPMGTTLTFEKQESGAALTVADLAGTWSGVESGAYGNYNYTMTINADGTGTLSYVDEGGSYPSGDMPIVSVTVDGNTVTVSYTFYDMPYTLSLTYADGSLTGEGAMMGELVFTAAE